MLYLCSFSDKLYPTWWWPQQHWPKHVADKLYTPDNIFVLWLLYPYRIITLCSNKHNGDDAPWICVHIFSIGKGTNCTAALCCGVLQCAQHEFQFVPITGIFIIWHKCGKCPTCVGGAAVRLPPPPLLAPHPHIISSNLLTRFHEDTGLQFPADFIVSSGHNRLVLCELATFSAALTTDRRWSQLRVPVIQFHASL